MFRNSVLALTIASTVTGSLQASSAQAGTVFLSGVSPVAKSEAGAIESQIVLVGKRKGLKHGSRQASKFAKAYKSKPRRSKLIKGKFGVAKDCGVVQGILAFGSCLRIKEIEVGF